MQCDAAVECDGCASVKFRMVVRKKFRMSAKVTECARAVRRGLEQMALWAADKSIESRLASREAALKSKMQHQIKDVAKLTLDQVPLVVRVSVPLVTPPVALVLCVLVCVCTYASRRNSGCTGRTPQQTNPDDTTRHAMQAPTLQQSLPATPRLPATPLLSLSLCGVCDTSRGTTERAGRYRG